MPLAGGGPASAGEGTDIALGDVPFLTARLISFSNAAAGNSSAAAAVTASSSAAPTRQDFPLTRQVKRPRRMEVLERAATAEERGSILAHFVEGMGSPSSRLGTCSLWTTWVEVHMRMFGQFVPVVPLTVSRLCQGLQRLASAIAHNAALSNVCMHVCHRRVATTPAYVFAFVSRTISQDGYSTHPLMNSMPASCCHDQDTTRLALNLLLQIRKDGKHSSN